MYYTNLFYKDLSEIKPVEIKENSYIEKNGEKYYLKKAEYFNFLWNWYKWPVILFVFLTAGMFFFSKILFFFNLILIFIAVFFAVNEKFEKLLHKKIVKKIIKTINIFVPVLLVFFGMIYLLFNRYGNIFIFLTFLFFEISFLNFFIDGYHKEIYYLKDKTDKIIKGFIVWREN